jgi:hypothetical protein
VWDGIFAAAAEMLMRKPGIPTLHAVTSTNALHFAYRTCADDRLRRLMLLQGAAFAALFRRREGLGKEGPTLDGLEAAPAASAAEVLAEVGRDNAAAARKALGLLGEPARARELIDAARLLVFLKGDDAHDYKFSSAVLEDFDHVSSGWRERVLAGSVGFLQGSTQPDNALVKRVRACLS